MVPVKNSRIKFFEDLKNFHPYKFLANDIIFKKLCSNVNMAKHAKIIVGFNTVEMHQSTNFTPDHKIKR